MRLQPHRASNRILQLPRCSKVASYLGRAFAVHKPVVINAQLQSIMYKAALCTQSAALVRVLPGRILLRDYWQSPLT